MSMQSVSSSVQSSRALPTQAGISASGCWLDMVAVLVAALALRLLFFNGAFGSDDTTYFARALDVGQGAWTSANYNGALRYGFNIPAGLFVYLFGPSIVVANLWPLLCSMIEIGAVYLVADALMGRRGAIAASIILAVAPLHVAVATRIHADPVVAAFLTLSFTTLFFALRRGSTWLLFVAGLFIGCVYWTKELAAVTFFAFLPLLAYFRRNVQGALLVMSGVILLIVMNCLLMWVLAGDPLHVIRVVLGALTRNFIEGGSGEDAPGFYVPYLLWDIRHVGLAGLLACVSVVLLGTRWRQMGGKLPAWGFILVWLVGLLVVLSLFPVSLSPLRFTMKQSNYITLFLAPLAIVAAYAVTLTERRLSAAMIAALAAVGTLGAALQQADYRAFAANSKGLLAVGQQHPAALLVGSTNNASLGTMLATASNSTLNVTSYRYADGAPEEYIRRASMAGEVLAIIDPQTTSWNPGRRPVPKALTCWVPLADVLPTGLGVGNQIAGIVARLAETIGGGPGARLSQPFERLAHPVPAKIYRVPSGDLWCERS